MTNTIKRPPMGRQAMLLVLAATAGCVTSGPESPVRGQVGTTGGAGGAGGASGTAGTSRCGSGGDTSPHGDGTPDAASGDDAAVHDGAINDVGAASDALGAAGAPGKDGGAGASAAAGSGAAGKNGGAGAGGSSGTGMAGIAGGAGAGGVSTMVTLTETPEAFRNPMKGFRPSRYIPDTSFKDYEYASTYKHYIAYSALESSAGDSAQKIKDWSDANWGGLRARNLKVIPRVTILYPGTGEFWGDIPHDGTPSQWTTDALKARLIAFTAKLGEAWDNDPRVAAVEMGLWGKWGEHNIWPDNIEGSDRIPASFQQALGDAFNAAFKNKKVMVRYPNTFASYTTFGFLWDSFALPDDDNSGGGAGMVARDLWRTGMQSGEVAYDWGNQSNLGGSPNGTLSSGPNTDYVIGYIRKVHTSSLGWIAEYTPDGGAISANAARMQKALGYRFTIKQATFTSAIASGGAVDVTFSVTNVGNAPFYYGWPVEVSLLDAARSVAWQGTFTDTDIRQWLPGSTTMVHGSFNPNVPVGTYTLAVTILDPAGNRPSLRFANTNYYSGGRTPLGRVGVGLKPANQDLGSFDALKPDNTLSY
jgi:Domain of unknown function (DUF4832)